MKTRSLVWAVLWAGTVAAAWWTGHRTGISSSTRTVTTLEGAAGPEKPKAPGQGTGQAAGAGQNTDAGNAQGAGTGPASVQSILAQVRSLMRMGGMQNPSAMLKTLTLLAQIPDADIQEALKEASGFKDPQAKMMVNMMLLSRWAEKDGPAALKYAEDNLGDAGPMVQMAKMGVLSAWAQNDPDAVWNHIQTNEDAGDGMFGGRGMMMMGMFSSLAAKDPDKAFARLAELDDPQERQMALNGMAQTAFDDASRTRLMEQISQLPDEKERGEARAAILGQVAMMDPEQAIKLTGELPETERKEAAQRVGSMLMMSDPERGATFMLENAEPENRKHTYNQIVAQWVNVDANKAGAWLGAQPQTPDLDNARMTFATSVAARDPESAMAWANTVSNENERTSAVQGVYTTWKGKDEAAARNAVLNSGLPQERIQNILSPPRAENTIEAAPSPVTLEKTSK